MSVSSRSTKAQMYSEIERLRELCDRQRDDIRALEDRLEGRGAQIASLNEAITYLKTQVGGSERQRPQPQRPQPQRPRPTSLAARYDARRKAAIELCKQLGVSSVTKDQVDEYLAA